VWLWLVACTCLRPSEPPAPDPHRSFIVIVADDLGNDKVGAYHEAPDPPRTPNIDALAGSGVLFRNAYVTPVCSSSRAALLTGRYGRRTGVGGIVSAKSQYGLQSSEVTLPEALDRGGQWSAAALGKWHLTGRQAANPYHEPLTQGFDRFRGSMGNLEHRRTGMKSYSQWEKNVDGAPVDVTTYATTDTTDEAIAAIRELPAPFFLWVAYNAPHAPYHWPPGAEQRPGKGAQYDAMVEYMDADIGRLLAAMTPEQRATTTIVFVGDNGTPREAIRPPFNPRHAKSSVHEGGINVPLIVSGAGVTGRGESAALVHGVDLLPTILDLAGVSADGLELDGVSFAVHLADPGAPSARKYLFSELLRPNGPPPFSREEFAIRDERYKLMRLKGGRWARVDLEGRFDEGPPLDEGIEEERFAALMAELQRIRQEVRFSRPARPSAPAADLGEPPLLLGDEEEEDE
jgi:arylsulfatase A-like enzyme